MIELWRKRRNCHKNVWWGPWYFNCSLRFFLKCEWQLLENCIYLQKGYRDFLAHFLRFDKLSHNLSLPGLNSVLKLTFLLQMQIQRCICKKHHFLLSLIRAISMKKMKMTYSNRDHYWIISQIQMKLLSSAEKVEHSSRSVLPSNFSFFHLK